MRGFCGLLEEEIKGCVMQQNEPPYRQQQLCDWVYRKGVANYDAMTNIPPILKEILTEKMPLGLLTLKQMSPSCDGETVKFLWKLCDGYYVESVLICSNERYTICLSSQVGCAARCVFCASGKKGFLRNLSSAEIIEQVVHINSYLLAQQHRATHIVFMGMGEPMNNYDALLRALKILINPHLFAFSSRKITISTVGIIPGIEKLMHEDMNVNLALSLHAPNQSLRKKIVPSARQYHLSDILRVVRNYAQIRKRDITYEYVLIAGINDKKTHAYELVTLLKNEQCCVNLIPFNPISDIYLKRPDKAMINAFRSILFDGGIKSTWRYTKGKDIMAACGQLALK